MSAAALLAELEGAGIRLTCEGDRLRVRGEPGVRLAPYTERLREHKPALLAALRERELPDRHDTSWETHRLAPDEAAALGLDPTLAWTRVDRAPVQPTIPPDGWDGTLCGGCQWPELCRVLGPRGPHLPDGPCAAWPRVERQPER